MISQELRRVAAVVTDVTDYTDQADPLQDTALFNVETAPEVIRRLQQEVAAPYVNASLATLGGPAHASIMLTISLDPREKWVNGYLENSRYGKFSFQRNGVVERFSGSRNEKFRKVTGKSVDAVIAKLNQWVTQYNANKSATQMRQIARQVVSGTYR
jgi:hypothetical protein